MILSRGNYITSFSDWNFLNELSSRENPVFGGLRQGKDMNRLVQLQKKLASLETLDAASIY